MPNLLGWVRDIVGPITRLIDSLHTSDGEKLELKNKLAEIENAAIARALEYHETIIESQTRIVESEAKGASWLQRNWRPITMLTFLILITLDVLGFLEYRLSDEAWTLLQIGIGGYLIGRSIEKAAPTVADVVTAKRDRGTDAPTKLDPLPPEHRPRGW